MMITKSWTAAWFLAVISALPSTAAEPLKGLKKVAAQKILNAQYTGPKEITCSFVIGPYIAKKDLTSCASLRPAVNNMPEYFGIHGDVTKRKRKARRRNPDGAIKAKLQFKYIDSIRMLPVFSASIFRQAPWRDVKDRQAPSPLSSWEPPFVGPLQNQDFPKSIEPNFKNVRYPRIRFMR